MKQRLDRKSRIRATSLAVVKEGRAHGRKGWVTQSIVAHAMDIRPGCYVLGLLQELFRDNKLERKIETAKNGTRVYKFRWLIRSQDRDWIPF